MALAFAVVIGVGIFSGWSSLLTASDSDAKSSSSGSTVVASPSTGQAKSAPQSSKGKKSKPQPKPEDVATSLTKIDRSLKEAEDAKAKSDWGAAFRATVKAWEVARFHRDDVKIKPKLKSIEVALEELGQKANMQYEAEIRSRDVVHMEK